MSQLPPFFHADSGTVRFWTLIGDDWVGASISKETLHYVFNRDKSDDQPLPTYLAHAAAIEAAVRRRIAGGSYQPVILREPDLRLPA
nr:DUF1488 family protein [uncultured Roseateles sp.]